MISRCSPAVTGCGPSVHQNAALLRCPTAAAPISRRPLRAPASSAAAPLAASLAQQQRQRPRVAAGATPQQAASDHSKRKFHEGLTLTAFEGNSFSVKFNHCGE
jgi:hypothetical protein